MDEVVMRVLTMKFLYTSETPTLRHTWTFTQKSCKQEEFQLSKENEIL